jgi:hypothetical protein
VVLFNKNGIVTFMLNKIITMQKIIFGLSAIIGIGLLSCKQGTNSANTATIATPNNNPAPISANAKADTTPSSNTVANTAVSKPNSITSFLPANYSVLDSAIGDLNLDGINDILLVLKKDKEEQTSDPANNKQEKRPLLILLKDATGNISLAKKNDNIIYCINCGGAMGDPYQKMVIKNGFFSIEYYGGSAERWSRIITFKYDKQFKDWYLHKDGIESFNANNPSKIDSEIKTTKDFGQVKFTDFDIYIW